MSCSGYANRGSWDRRWSRTENWACSHEEYKLFGLSEGEWIEEHSVDDGEDDGVARDASGERKDDRKREAGSPAKLPERIA